MNVTPSQVVRALLIENGLAELPSSSAQWPITIGNMPSGKDVSDRYLTIKGTGGEIEGMIHKLKKHISHPTVQIWSRSVIHSEAELKLRTIEEFLPTTNRDTVTVNGFTVEVNSILVKIPTAWVKQEEQNQRQLYVLNLQMTINEV